MDNKVKIEPKDIDLSKLKTLLNHGDLKTIARQSGYTPQYVSQVLSPNQPERFCADVIIAAVRFIENRVSMEVDSSIATAITKNGDKSVRKSTSN